SSRGEGADCGGAARALWRGARSRTLASADLPGGADGAGRRGASHDGGERALRQDSSAHRLVGAAPAVAAGKLPWLTRVGRGPWTLREGSVGAAARIIWAERGNAILEGGRAPDLLPRRRMRLSELDYHLPPELIAQEPLERRAEARLLVLDRRAGTLEHARFYKLRDFLRDGDLLVLNDTRVFPARLFARKPSGGAVELLIVRPVEQPRGAWMALARTHRGLREGTR